MKQSIVIFDTTLRDGEQSPGASMTLEEKVRIAKLLQELGVDVIEAGFPIASEGDFAAVQAVSKAITEPVVCALARSAPKDIEAAGKALKFATKKRIHTFISTSKLHMKYKLKMKSTDVLEAIARSVKQARQYTEDVEWSPEDASRTEPDFLCRSCEVAIKSGATTINIPDTVGYSTPLEFGGIFKMLLEKVRGAEKATFSAHCHNDLGLAVANTLAAIANGARQAECTINGIGERAGNAALEEIVMALKTRPKVWGCGTSIRTKHLTAASNLVAAITGFTVQPNKAIVGKNAFAHEAGIHQDGMLKHSSTYEIMTPQSVGAGETSLVLGKHSGRHAFRNKLVQMGFEGLEEAQLNEAFTRFKKLADRKKIVFEEDIAALVSNEIMQDKGRCQFQNLEIHCVENQREVTVHLLVDGKAKSATVQSKAKGSGVVDAMFRAIKKAYPHEASLQLYQVHAVTKGTDAQAEVNVRIQGASGQQASKQQASSQQLSQNNKGRTAIGQSADMDTLMATGRAYVNAVNRLYAKPTIAAKSKPAFGGI